jgi:FMN-dependent NADH-azoreductase
MNILHVISSPRPDSYSVQLGNHIVEKLQASYPDSALQVRDLARHPFPHLEEVHIQSFNTPAGQRTAGQQVAIQHSDAVIDEVQAADILVIGAPLYNLGIASTLKAWIDHLVRAGITFQYTATGPQGLLKGKKVYVALSSGGIYSEGPLMAYDFASPYLKTILGFIGIYDVTIVRVEGTSIPGLQDIALSKAMDSLTVLDSLSV